MLLTEADFSLEAAFVGQHSLQAAIHAVPQCGPLKQKCLFLETISAFQFSSPPSLSALTSSLLNLCRSQAKGGGELTALVSFFDKEVLLWELPCELGNPTWLFLHLLLH